MHNQLLSLLFVVVGLEINVQHHNQQNGTPTNIPIWRENFFLKVYFPFFLSQGGGLFFFVFRFTAWLHLTLRLYTQIES